MSNDSTSRRLHAIFNSIKRAPAATHVDLRETSQNCDELRPDDSSKSTSRDPMEILAWIILDHSYLSTRRT